MPLGKASQGAPVVIHKQHKPICPRGDTLKPQSECKHHMNLCSSVSDLETFHF